MLFRKKKMVDIRDLPKTTIPVSMKSTDFTTKTSGGFVDLTKPGLPLRAVQTSAETTADMANETASAFSFFDNASANPTTSTESSYGSSDSLELKDLIRKVSMQVSELDSQIYKLEQRLEVVERKTGSNQDDSSSSNDSGLIGW